MSEPIRIALSNFQSRRLAALDADIASLNARKNEAITSIVGQEHDPVVMAQNGWKIEWTATEVICTPPAAPAVSSQE